MFRHCQSKYNANLSIQSDSFVPPVARNNHVSRELKAHNDYVYGLGIMDL